MGSILFKNVVEKDDALIAKHITDNVTEKSTEIYQNKEGSTSDVTVPKVGTIKQIRQENIVADISNEKIAETCICIKPETLSEGVKFYEPCVATETEESTKIENVTELSGVNVDSKPEEPTHTEKEDTSKIEQDDETQDTRNANVRPTPSTSVSHNNTLRLMVKLKCI